MDTNSSTPDMAAGSAMVFHDTNNLGGRVAVTSYAPWKTLERAWKRRQMLAVCDWISGGRLPLVIENHAWVMPFVRTDAAGKAKFILLFNTSFDDVEPLKLNLRECDARTSIVLCDETGEHPIPAEAVSDGLSVSIPLLRSWRTLVLKVGT